MIKVEFINYGKGKTQIKIENDPNDYWCGHYEIDKIFSELGNRIEMQFIEGCTIFLLGNKQVEKVKARFTESA